MKFFILSLLFLLRAQQIFAAEKLGQLKVADLLIRANFTSLEGNQTYFDLIGSQFSIAWERDEKLSGTLVVGSEKMKNLPVYYAATVEDKMGVVAGYAEYKDFYGRFRFGLIPMEFGYDGLKPLNEQIFNRSLFYTERIIGIYDQGLSFYTENNGYYTQLIAHNGEVDTTHDGRLWTTGHWGYDNGRNFQTQLSLQSGYVEGALSQGANNSLAGVFNGETARWRNGLFFINWYPRTWNLVLEVGGGEMEQGESEGRYTTGLFEISKKISPNFTAGFRYNEFDPNSKTSGDNLRDLSAVLVVKTDDSNSKLLLIGTKSKEQRNEVHDDQLRLVWVLTPVAH